MVFIIGLIFFVFVVLVGFVIVVWIGQWWMLVVGVVCIVVVWFYIGGKCLYGYYGLGEVFVFVFFGFVVMFGIMWVQIFDLLQQVWLGVIVVGLFVCVVLFVNNLCDIDQDCEVGKCMFMVLIGCRVIQVLFILFVFVLFGIVVLFVLLFLIVWILFFVLLVGFFVILIVWIYCQFKELVIVFVLIFLMFLLYVVVFFWVFVG